MKAKIGYSWADITPPIGIRLGGYAHRFGKPSETIHDPLKVKAILLRACDEEILLLSADVLGIYKDFADSVKLKIQEKTGINTDNIFFTTTHTHSAPETIIPMWPNTFPYKDREKILLNKWMKRFKERIIEVSIRACKRISKVSVAKLGITSVKGLTFNRVFKNGPIDPLFSLIYFKSSDRILLTNYGCHPVCNTDLGISADYPGVLSSTLFKHGFANFFVLGACGNIDPIEKGREFMQKMGRKLASSALKCLEGNASNLSLSSLKIESRKIHLKLRNVHNKGVDTVSYILLKIIPQQLLSSITNEKIKRFLIQHLLMQDEKMEIAKEGKTACETVIHVFTIDDVAFITIPGELFVETGIKIRHAATLLGYKNAIIAACSEDYIGYIPVKELFKLKIYETTLARWSRVTEEAERSIYKETVEALKKLKE